MTAMGHERRSSPSRRLSGLPLTADEPTVIAQSQSARRLSGVDRKDALMGWTVAHDPLRSYAALRLTPSKAKSLPTSGSVFMIDISCCWCRLENAKPRGG